VSPDGKMIAYSFKDPSTNPPERFANPARGVAITTIAGGAPTKIFQISNLTSFRWTADGRSLLFTKNEGGVDNFWSQPIAGESPKQLTHFKNGTIESFDVSRDGKWVVMSRGTARQDVVLIHDLSLSVWARMPPTDLVALKEQELLRSAEPYELGADNAGRGFIPIYLRAHIEVVHKATSVLCQGPFIATAAGPDFLYGALVEASGPLS